jgi:hypothetical protein
MSDILGAILQKVHKRLRNAWLNPNPSQHITIDLSNWNTSEEIYAKFVYHQCSIFYEIAKRDVCHYDTYIIITIL